MLKKIAILTIIPFSLFTAVHAQLRDIPSEVKDAFATQYPQADNVSYKDNLTSVSVSFTLNKENMTARYDNHGTWKETEKTFTLDSIPQEVKDGWNKSKYADWKAEETSIIFLPADAMRYRIKVSKNDVQKKYLYFNKEGRLLRDAITL